MKNEIRETSRTLRKKEEISERKVINLKQSVRTNLFQTWVEANMNYKFKLWSSGLLHCVVMW